MPNRIQTPATHSGFGLVAWLEATKIALPLKGVECRFTVCGDLLNVEIDQIFHQNSSRPLDCLYTFPLPAAAAVYRCEMHLNDRMICARVEEVERAREIVREKKAAGHRTALVEMERDNLFTLSLGNVQPDDIVVIRFAYFETLTRLADWTSFTIPFCPGIRFVPGAPLLRRLSGRGTVYDTDQVPDASRISPPRIDRLHADGAYLTIEGTLEDPHRQVRDITSPTHPILVQDGASFSKVSLANRSDVPDSNFVLRWTEIPAVALSPVGWGVQDQDESFALVRLEAPPGSEADNDYAQDIYFLLDRSGSMQGLKWEKTALAFREFVKGLGPKDRIWATLFNSAFRDFAEKPLSPAEILLDPAVQQLEKLRPSDGTELLPALTHVLKKIAIHSPDRPVSLVLITDGQVANEREILKHLQPFPNLRVHTFGIDLTTNDGFLKKMASQQRGTSYLLAPSDDIVGAIARLGNRLRRPILTAIQSKDEWQLPDGGLPDLHAGECLSVSLKGPHEASAVSIRGQLSGREEKLYRFELVKKHLPAVRLLWARRRIEYHLAHGEREAALALARKHNLICEGAAFVAWDETEKVPVTAMGDEIYQPSFEPKQLAGDSGMVGAGAVPSLDGFVYSAESSSFRLAKLLSAMRARSAAAKHPSGAEKNLFELMRQSLPSPQAHELINLIQEWTCDDPAEVPARTRQVRELAEELITNASEPTARLAIIARWIEVTWNGPFLNRARNLLDLLLNSAQRP